LKNYVNIISKGNNKKKFGKKIIFVVVLNVTENKGGSGPGSRARPVSQMYGSLDPDPYQNVTNLEHWFLEKGKKNILI
jgi:hypothetical protein